jgi:hypothetical protein
MAKHVAVPQELDAIVLRALERDKKARYSSAFDFAKQLEEFRGSKALERLLSGQDLGRTTEESLEALMKAASESSDPYTDPEFEAATAQRPSAEISQQRPASSASDQVHQAPTNQKSVATGSVPVASPYSTLPSTPVPPNVAGAGTDAPTEMDLKPLRPGAADARTELDLPPVRRPAADAPTEMDLPPVRRPAADAPTEMDLAPIAPPPRREPSGEVPRTVVGHAPVIRPIDADAGPASSYPSDKSGPASYYPGEVSRTAVAVGGGRPRRIDEPPPEEEPPYEGTEEYEEFPAELTEAEMALAPKKHPLLAKPFPPLVAALFVATLGAILAGKFSGNFAFLLVYAVAAALWALAMLTAKKMPLKRVLLLAAGFRLIGFVADPVLSNEVYRYRWDGIVSASEQNPYLVAPDDPAVAGLRASSSLPIENPGIPTNRPPWAQLFFVSWAWLGGNLFFWRLMLLAADMVTVWLLWKPAAPRAALAWALFPLAVFEGFWNGHLEIVGAMLVLATCRLALKQQAMAAGAVLGFAGGTSLLPLAALSATMDALNHRLRALVPMFAVLFMPYAIVGIGEALFDPLTRAVQSSPTLRLVQDPVGQWVEGQGWAVALSGIWKNVSPRVAGGAYDEWVSAHLTSQTLATLLLVLVVLIVLKMASVKSANAEGAFASCIGVLLLISFAAQPSWWLLVVPVAILSNRPVWMLFALFSPTLYLASSGSADVNWLVYGVSYVMPLLFWLGTRLGKKEDRSAFDYRESYR